MRRIIVTPRAASDVLRLEEWLADRGAIHAAERLSIVLQDAIESLAQMPNRGRQPLPGMRELVVGFGSGAYLIRYQVRPDAVVIGRILHRLERR